MVDISTLIRIQTSIESGAVTRQRFGRGLLLTTDDLIPAGGTGKAVLFESLAEATDFFDAGSDALADATIWFAQDPQPQGLYCGRWADVDVPTSLRGGTPAAVADITGSPTSTFTINGAVVTVDLSAGTLTTYAGIATEIQTAVVALAGIYVGATFTYGGGVFTLTLAGSDEISGGALGDTASTTDIDIAALLGMSAADEPRYVLGASAEGVASAATTIRGLIGAGDPVALLLARDVPATDPSDMEDTRGNLSDYAQGSEAVCFLLDTSAQALVTGDTTSQAALAYEGSQGDTFAFYSAAGQRPDVATAAILSAQNLSGRGSVTSPHAKALTNVAPTAITSAQYEELARKRVNVYTSVGGQPSLLGGFASRDGYWADAVWWLIWLRTDMNGRIWSAMRSSRRLTRAIMLDAILETMEAGVRNGGIQPGRVVPGATKADIISATGNDAFDGTLTVGYLVHVQTPTQADRDARIARFRAWVAGSDGIHEIDGNIVFRN